jgi:CRISPR-associated protein Csm4
LDQDIDAAPGGIMIAIFDLSLHGALHLGEFTGVNREKSLEWIPSDTLFAALVEAWARLGANIEERLSTFPVRGRDEQQHEPPLLLTSAFPRAGQVRFFPAPPVFRSGKIFEGESYKKAKKVRWLSKGVLDALVQGDDPDGTLIQSGGVWVTAEESNHLIEQVGTDRENQITLWAYQSVPHVTVDRLTNASNLFYTGRMVFGPHCGLWFAARGEVDWVREALPYLQDSGLGGLRSTGHGGFSFTSKEEDFPSATDDYGLLLSRYAPMSEAEVQSGLQAENSYYQFVTVGGWYRDEDGHPWRRRSVRMIAEGALLPVSAVKGGLVNVRPDQVQRGPATVYRSGLAFFVPAGKIAEVL